jgi:hypothetical protein
MQRCDRAELHNAGEMAQSGDELLSGLHVLHRLGTLKWFNTLWSCVQGELAQQRDVDGRAMLQHGVGTEVRDGRRQIGRSATNESWANIAALDCCWAGFTIKRNPPVVQSFFIIRRNKLDAFDVAAA